MGFLSKFIAGAAGGGASLLIDQWKYEMQEQRALALEKVRQKYRAQERAEDEALTREGWERADRQAAISGAASATQAELDRKATIDAAQIRANSPKVGTKEYIGPNGEVLKRSVLLYPGQDGSQTADMLEVFDDGASGKDDGAPGKDDGKNQDVGRQATSTSSKEEGLLGPVINWARDKGRELAESEFGDQDRFVIEGASSTEGGDKKGTALENPVQSQRVKASPTSVPAFGSEAGDNSRLANDLSAAWGTTKEVASEAYSATADSGASDALGQLLRMHKSGQIAPAELLSRVEASLPRLDPQQREFAAQLLAAQRQEQARAPESPTVGAIKGSVNYRAQNPKSQRWYESPGDQ